MANISSSPSPWSWTPSTFWDGHDGLWNTFEVRVGTPPQAFRVLPYTAEQATWVIHPDGCLSEAPRQCAYDRGVLAFQDSNSTGFQSNESSTWDLIGIYTLSGHGERMGYNGNGVFGLDNVALGESDNTDELELPDQVVAAVADKDYFLGQVGLGYLPSNFSDFNDPIPNYLATLVDKNKIPSLSYGYTAGAAWRSRAPASLTFGGYDANRFNNSEVTFNTSEEETGRFLEVGLQKILAENTLRGTVSLLPEGIYSFIDSRDPYIWLPDDAIDECVSAFGLLYDNKTDLYLVNDTTRETLIRASPTITFILGDGILDQEGETQSIRLPYAAFDLQASYPLYGNETVNYFPIKRANASNQYTIVRTFLQEAYIIVDWERQNFTVAQARFDELDRRNIVTITPKRDDEEEPSPTPLPDQSGPGLSGGAIAGIAVGIVSGLALIGTVVYFWMRRRKQRHLASMFTADAKTANSDANGYVDQSPKELHGDSRPNELHPEAKVEMEASTTFVVYLDGVRACTDAVSLHRIVHCGINSVIDGITDTTDGQTTIRNFVFAALETTDAKPTDSDKNKALHLDEITVYLYRSRQKQDCVEQDDAADSRPPAKRPRKRTQPAEDERIPEKALKGRAISNHATFGKARVQHSSAKPVESKTRTVTDHPWGRDPITTSTFKYRSRKDLQIEGIIERSPSPVPLKDRDQDDLNPEEARELIRLMRDREEAARLVERDKGAKHMHAANESDEEGEITVTRTITKRAKTRASMEDLVDLTED